jgi:hypothetical protein
MRILGGWTLASLSKAAESTTHVRGNFFFFFTQMVKVEDLPGWAKAVRSLDAAERALLVADIINDTRCAFVSTKTRDRLRDLYERALWAEKRNLTIDNDGSKEYFMQTVAELRRRHDMNRQHEEMYQR